MLTLSEVSDKDAPGSPSRLHTRHVLSAPPDTWERGGGQARTGVTQSETEMRVSACPPGPAKLSHLS